MSGEAKARLLSEFQPASYADWREQAEEALNGAPFEKKLVSETYEGMALQPIYNASDIEGLETLAQYPGGPNYLRGISSGGYRSEPWLIAQELGEGTPAEVNGILKDALSRGQTAVRLRLSGAARRGLDPEGEAGGLSISSVPEIKAALLGVNLAKHPIYIAAGAGAPGVAALLLGYAKKEGVRASELSGGVFGDPLGELAQSGELPAPLETLYGEARDYTLWASASMRPDFKTVGVSTACYQDAGASAVEELAYAAATGAEYLRRVPSAGLSIDALASRMVFEYAVGPQFFMELAKLRAARVLWQQIVRAFGGSAEAQKANIIARTGRYQKTIFDPHVNLLRSTTEAFSAIAGGVQAITVSPFNEVFSDGDDASRRHARNTQIILQEECNLTDVIDPAGGSYLVEKLTAELARAAWTVFQQIEAQGGMFQTLLSGAVQSRLKQLSSARKKKLGQRRDVLVGTNMYANVREAGPKNHIAEPAARRVSAVRSFRSSGAEGADEAVLAKLNELVNRSGAERFEAALEAAKLGASLGEVSRALRGGSQAGERAEAVERSRLAEPYERLRLAALRFQAENGTLPKLFLANLGPLRQHKARADFSAGFFEVGGFEVIYPNGFSSPEEAAQAFKLSGARLAVICSTDETYPELVPPTVKALKAAVSGASVLLAGAPGEQEAVYREAGMDDYIFVKSNNFEVLERHLTKLGVL